MGQVPWGEPDASVVTYGVKELLADIKDSITRIDTKLDDKASKSDLHTLAERLVNVEATLQGRVATVEMALTERVTIAERGVEAIKNRAVGASAVVALAGSVAGYVVATVS